MPANSKASQLLNWFGNFMNGVSNAARDIVANPIADIANIWLKTNPYVAAANLATKWKVNKAIDTVTSAAKWEQSGSLQKQPEDPTSLAYAAWEGLTRWIDQAAAVISLAEAARQLPKAAQKGWNKILNKVKDAKTKKQQMALAKEAREYLNTYEDPEIVSRELSNRTEVPSYQQRRKAEFYNTYFPEPSVRWVMEPYRWVKATPAWQMKTISNITEEFKNAPNSNVKSMIAESQINPDAYRKVYWPDSWWPMDTLNDATKLSPVNSSTTSDVNWRFRQQYRKWTYWDRLKASNQKFLDAAPTPRSKAIRTDEVKRANDLWMTAEQLRAEAKKYWGSTQWYYEQRKALDELWVNNFNDYAKTMGLNWWTPDIHEVQEYNKIKNRISL